MSDLPTIGVDGASFVKRSVQGKPGFEAEEQGSAERFDEIFGGFAPSTSSPSMQDEEDSRSLEDHGAVEEAGLAPRSADSKRTALERDQMLNALIGSSQPNVTSGAPDLADRALHVVEIDLAADHAKLAPALADHLAAMLGQAEPGAAKSAVVAAMWGQSAAQEAGSKSLRMSGQGAGGVVDNGPRGQAGRPELPSFKVTRNEMYFRPAATSFSDRLSTTESQLDGAGRAFRESGSGTKGGSPARLAIGGGNSLFSASEAMRNINGDAGRILRNAMMVGRTPASADGATSLPVSLPAEMLTVSAVRGVDAGVRTKAVSSLLRPEMAQANSGPLRVLHIQLQPVELGRIELRIRAIDGGIEVHVEASRRETYALLQQDRDLIASILRKAGHPVETVTITIGERGTESMAGNNGAQLPDGRAGPTYGDARSGTGQSGQGQAARAAEDPKSSGVQDDQDPPALAARHRSSLYL